MKKLLIVIIFICIALTSFAANAEVEKYLQSGNAKFNLENFKEAIKDYSKAIKIDPQLGQAYYQRGLAKSNLHDYKGAILDFDRVIGFGQKYSQPCGGIKPCTKNIEIEPKLTEVYLSRGVANSKLKNDGDAFKDYNKSIELDPDNATAYSLRAGVRRNLGDKKGASEDDDTYSKIINKLISETPATTSSKISSAPVKTSMKINNITDNDNEKNIPIQIGEKYSSKQLAKKGFVFDLNSVCNDYIMCFTYNLKKHEAYWGKIASDGKMRVKGRIEIEEDDKGKYFISPCNHEQAKYFPDTVYEK